MQRPSSRMSQGSGRVCFPGNLVTGVGDGSTGGGTPALADTDTCAGGFCSVTSDGLTAARDGAAATVGCGTEGCGTAAADAVRGLRLTLGKPLGLGLGRATAGLLAGAVTVSVGTGAAARGGVRGGSTCGTIATVTAAAVTAPTDAPTAARRRITARPPSPAPAARPCTMCRCLRFFLAAGSSSFRRLSVMETICLPREAACSHSCRASSRIRVSSAISLSSGIPAPILKRLQLGKPDAKTLDLFCHRIRPGGCYA